LYYSLFVVELVINDSMMNEVRVTSYYR